MIMSKSHKDQLIQVVLITMLLIFIQGCARGQGYLYLDNQFWNADSSASFNYKEFSLGVTGGYQTIEVNGIEVLRFDYAVIYGGWLDANTIIIVSNDPPVSQNMNELQIDIILEKATSSRDYRKHGTMLKHLAQPERL